ncbi:MAG: hypothetical protein RIB84_06625 [Sneathiellaceae bacterium]
MKSARLLVILALFLGLLALAYWMVHQPRLRLLTARQIELAEEAKQAVQARPACPLQLAVDGTPAPLPADAQTQGLAPPLARWEIVRSDGEGKAPRVSVQDVQVASADGRQVPACILTVDALPEPPFDGIDWRIGYRLDLSALPQGPFRQARFRADVQPDRAVTMGGASAYLYDGTQPVGQSLVELTADRRAVEVTAALSGSAQFVEVWFRLAFQGTISAPVSLTIADPRLDLRTGG